MARYLGPKMKICRRLGVQLSDKAARFFAKRDIKEQRTTTTGRRKKKSQYGERLEEKQKVKAFYGVLERQFRNYYRVASSQPGNTGENLLQLLERRLDNVVYRAGFANSRAQARQFIVHGHVRVNGEKVDVPSFLVEPEMIIAPAKSDKSKTLLNLFLDHTRSSHKPSWLEIADADGQTRAKVASMPTRDQIELEVNEQLIVELLSR
ncbi:MAG: 30S ribosomal protein S4 [Planctomycetota bacterium]